MPDLRGIVVVTWACLTLGAPCAAQDVDRGTATRQADSNVDIIIVNGQEATFRFRHLPGSNGFATAEVLASRYQVRVTEGEDLAGAVIDRPIDVIAVYKPDAFLWGSRRLQRDVLLNTLPADRAATRYFLYRELFPAK